MATDEQTSTNQARTPSEGEEESHSPGTSPSSAVKGKERAVDLASDREKEESEGSLSSGGTSTPAGNETTPDDQQWKAIYAPQYNSYYFYNIQTGETTWENPLQPSGSSIPASTESPPESSTIPDSASPEDQPTSSSASQYSALQAAALAQGIDPSLAYLDPALLAATSSGAPGPAPSFQAKFNARTGAFTRPDARTPGHLSEYERMKRMSEFYFDVNAWEQQIANDKIEEEEEGPGKKRKRPSKKDLERFKEQKRLKKIAKTAWLRT